MRFELGGSDDRRHREIDCLNSATLHLMHM